MTGKTRLRGSSDARLNPSVDVSCLDADYAHTGDPPMCALPTGCPRGRYITRRGV
jgi:hypothetical protein